MGSCLGLGNYTFDSKMESAIAFKLIEDCKVEIPNLIFYNEEDFSFKIKRTGIALICLKIREISFSEEWIRNYTLENMDDFIPEIHGDKEKFIEGQLEGFKDAFNRVSDVFFYTLCSMEICKQKKVKTFWV